MWYVRKLKSSKWMSDERYGVVLCILSSFPFRSPPPGGGLGVFSLFGHFESFASTILFFLLFLWLISLCSTSFVYSLVKAYLYLWFRLVIRGWSQDPYFVFMISMYEWFLFSFAYMCIIFTFLSHLLVSYSTGNNYAQTDIISQDVGCF